MNEEAQNALAELERMKAEMAAKLAAVSQMMKQMKDAQKPEEKPSEPAPEPADEQEQTTPAPAPEAQNAPENEPERICNKEEKEAVGMKIPPIGLKTMQDFANWLNEEDGLPTNWEDVAEARGWKICENNERDFCTDGESVVTMLDSGEIAVRPIQNPIQNPTEDEQNAEQAEPETKPDGEDKTEDSGNKEDGEENPADNKGEEKPADKPEGEKPPKWEWKATNPTEEMMKAYFDKNASPELRAKVEGKKTIQGAYKHCAEWAKKQITEAMMKAARSAGLSGVLVQGLDEDLMCEMIHYFEEDSLNCEWKPTPKPSHNKPTMHPLPTEMPKPAPKKPDPQMTLFDF